MITTSARWKPIFPKALIRFKLTKTSISSRSPTYATSQWTKSEVSIHNIKKEIIPGESKSYTLRLPQNAVSSFIDRQDTIYAHRAGELFKNRRTVAIRDDSSASKRRGSSAKAGSGTPTYYKIKNGDTLGAIAAKYGVRVKDLQNWNGLRGTNISAGKRLKIYK